MVTVALRRADLSGKRDPFANILEFIDPAKYLILPNTSGAMNAEEAVRLARLAAAAGLFIVPSFAALQAWTPKERRARGSNSHITESCA